MPVALPSVPNPFPGLRPFDASLHDLFFGREEQVKWLLNLLKEQHFLSVVGPSGSGKSSLIRAGVVPTLQGESDDQHWVTALCKPGVRLLDNVAQAIEGMGARDVRDRVLQGADGLVKALEEAGFGDGRNALLIVDQFEELFRLQGGEEEVVRETSLCIEAIIHAIRQRRVPIYIILTMRSEFLGHCTLYPGLAETINEADYLVPRMTPAQLYEAVERPVIATGRQISTELVKRVLADVNDNEDQLPVLQHAMMRTWDHWKEDHGHSGEPLQIAHYEAIGTVTGALSKHAEEIYQTLPNPDAQRAAESIFRTLGGATSSSGGRHPAALGALVEIAGVPESAAVQAAELFRQPGCWFLTPSVDVVLTADTVLDLAHESLVRLWERAQGWSEEEQASAHLYLRLASTAALYQEGQAGLYQDPDLELAIAWRTRSQPTASWGRRYDPSFERAMTFLEHSRKERDFEMARREDEQRRKLQRTRRLAVLMGSVSLVFLSMMVFALNLYFSAEENRKEAIEQQQAAEEERRNAERQQQVAIEQREVAEEERRNAERQQQVAIEQREVAEEERHNAERQQQIAIEQREVAEEERHNAERQQQIAIEQREVAEEERHNAERHQQIAIEQKRNAERLRLLSVARALAIQATEMQPREEQRQLAALLALQAFYFNQRYGGSPQEPDIYTALRVVHEMFGQDHSGVLRGHADGVRAVVFTPTGRELLSADDDGVVRRWSLGDQVHSEILWHRAGVGVRQLVFDRAGHLAVGTSAGGVWVWDAQAIEARELARIPDAAAVSAMGFAADGRLIAAGLNGGAHAWDTATGREEAMDAVGKPGRLYAMATEGQYLAIGGEDGRISLWETADWQQAPRLLEAGRSAIRSLAFTADGMRLAAGAESGDLLVWESGDWEAGPRQLLGHTSAIAGLSFGSTGHLLASASLDRTLRIWDVQSGKSIVITQDDWVWDVAFSPDERWLASAGADRTVRLWYTHVEELAASVATRLERDMTPTEWQSFVGEDIPYEQTRAHSSSAAP